MQKQRFTQPTRKTARVEQYGSRTQTMQRAQAKKERQNLFLFWVMSALVGSAIGGILATLTIGETQGLLGTFPTFAIGANAPYAIVAFFVAQVLAVVLLWLAWTVVKAVARRVANG